MRERKQSETLSSAEENNRGIDPIEPAQRIIISVKIGNSTAYLIGEVTKIFPGESFP